MGFAAESENTYILKELESKLHRRFSQMVGIYGGKFRYAKGRKFCSLVGISNKSASDFKFFYKWLFR